MNLSLRFAVLYAEAASKGVTMELVLQTEFFTVPRAIEELVMLKTSITLILLLSLCSTLIAQQQKEDYLSWTSRQAFNIGRKWRMAGRVGWELKVFPTTEVLFYDLRATLMTPEAIRAAARLEQLRRRLTDAETRDLVSEAVKIDGLVAVIEINPREGSGVIPLDWRTTLQPKGAGEDSPFAIAGMSMPELRHLKALATVGQRDYAYDVFWVVFPMRDRHGKLIWETPPDAIELVVGIRDKQGRVSWRVDDSLRQRLISSTQESTN